MIKLNGEEILIRRFSNNEINVMDFKELIRKQNTIELKYEDDSDLIALMFVKKRFDELFMVPCSLFIWYMPYERMDRKIEGKLFSLKYICEFINSLNFLTVVVMEPHSNEVLKYLQNAKAVYPVKEWLTNILEEKDFTDYDCVVFPDAGAAERYSDCKLKNVCIIDKKRNTETDCVAYSYLLKGKVNEGSRAIIVDDLCSKGDTLKNAISILEQLGVNTIYIIVAHCEKNILGNGFFRYKSPVKMLYTSTSIMEKYHPKVKYMEVDVKKYM